MKTLYYFGTALDEHGHYFWLFDERGVMRKADIYFRDLPFNPEELTTQLSRRGLFRYYNHKGYSILAIKGSCYDTRQGCKTVFWVKEDLEELELIERIKNETMAVVIINQLPFSCELLTPKE